MTRRAGRRDAARAPGRTGGGIAGAALVLALLAALFVQAPVLRAPFLADDFLFLDQVRHRSLAAVLAAPDPIGNFYRPVGRQAWFWLLARLGGESERPLHVASLVVFLAALVLLYAIARRLAGARAAAIATGVAAVHYAADVPLQWASGSQDLLSLAGATAVLVLHRAGRRLAAAIALLLALWSKETVVLLPLVAVVADRRPGESWRPAAVRAWPLAAATLVWAVTRFTGAGAAATGGGVVALTPLAVPAALLHLVQVVLGVELPLRAYRPFLPLGHLVAIGLAVAAAWVARERAPQAAPEDADPRRAVWVGVVWALAGALPVALVATIWSAYFYLFAVFGAALAIGAALATRPPAVAAVVVAALGLASVGARFRTDFADAPRLASMQSHVNTQYLGRAGGLAAHYLEQLRALHPELPPNSTLYWANISSFVGWQSGDGPLVRWAYRDSSLRSYYLTQFRLEQARRGPVFFFLSDGSSLREFPKGPDELRQVAFSQLVSDVPVPGRDVLRYDEARRNGVDAPTSYWRAWAEWAAGDSLAARAALARAGVNPARSGASAAAFVAALAAGDTAAALRHGIERVAAAGLDPAAHAELADLQLAIPRERHLGAMEALAARLLAPDDAAAWIRWGRAQATFGRPDLAVVSFARARTLAGSASPRALEADSLIAAVRRATGDAIQAPP